MTPATAAQPNVLNELAALEAEHAELAANADTLSRDHWQRHVQLQGAPARDQRGLYDDLRTLLVREPQLFASDGTPLDPDSPAGQIAAEIEQLSAGLDDLARDADHAKAIANRKHQDVQAYVRAHFAEIMRDLLPEARDVAAATNEAARIFAAQLDNYLAFHARVHGLCALVQRDGDATLVRSIPGQEAAANFKRSAEDVDLPAPIPEASA